MARRRFRLKNKALTAKRLGLILLIAAVVVGAAAGISALVRQKDSFGTVTELPFYSESEYIFRNGAFYYIDGNELVYFDPSNTENASRMTLGTQGVKMCSSSALSVLYAGSSVQILGQSEVIDAGGTVLRVRCGTSHIAVMHEDAASAASVAIYDANGALIDTINEGSSALIDCGLYESASGDILWTLMLDTSGSVPVNTITTYTYAVDGAGVARASMSGVLSVQGQLAEDVIFTAKSIFIAGTSQLIRCDSGVSGEAYRLLTYGYTLSDWSTSGAKPLFVYEPRTASDIRRVKLYSTSESDVAEATAREVNLPASAVGYAACGGKLYVFTADELTVYTAAGAVSAQYGLDFVCDGAVKLSEKCIAVSSNGSMKLITLK